MTATKADRLAETMRRIHQHVRQAVALAKTIQPQVVELRRDGSSEDGEDWDPVELESRGADTGLLSMGLSVFLVCSAWGSPGTRAKLNRIRALADEVPVQVTTLALANVIIDQGRWTTITAKKNPRKQSKTEAN